MTPSRNVLIPACGAEGDKMGVMSTTLLRVLSQRRPSVLTQEAPRREELEAVLRAAAEGGRAGM